MEMGLEVRKAKNSRLRGLDEVIPGRGLAPCRSLGGTAWSEQPRSVRLGELCRLVGEGSQPLKGGGAQRERGHPGKTGAGLGQRGPGRAEARGTERCERAERGGWMRRRARGGGCGAAMGQPAHLLESPPGGLLPCLPPLLGEGAG